jgi:hypothetical protein
MERWFISREWLVARLQLTWFDDHGKEIGHLGEPDDYYQVELSPDGKKAAAAIGSF